jgi:hypothetical protein
LKKFSLSVASEEPTQNLTVLKIASASRNSSSQIYPQRIQLTPPNLDDLHKKILKKLNLHGIKDVDSQVNLYLANDRIEDFESFDAFREYDLKIDSITETLRLKWSFIFDSAGNGNPHPHCVSLRFSETPAPGAFLQKMLSARAGDQDENDPDFFAPTVCKLDFADSRFASELFAVVSDWIKAQPKIEPIFAFVLKVREHEDLISRSIANTLPTIALFAYVGIWLGLVPDVVSNSVKYAVAWTLAGGALFLLARYVASSLGRVLQVNIRRMSLAPIFQLTSGDSNRITRYLAKSQKSALVLMAMGILYGLSQGLGLYLASKILTHIF